ncbi:Glucans biosynthesis glucosyltransferase H [Pandoraea terrae]|uniref:Glucans biosynthesis glucosyltransferase H n=1 Tax=Pandoraea terrae TaxID=1537710 RepID=A0A5E4TYB2_9BURK|nr:glucans biosynthesis glucosyltransferase MdoH [Pandoraea terrae]VVD90859.1 Glucans biosynthesis glucosyltransferase H [Pandoraea terrae]
MSERTDIPVGELYVDRLPLAPEKRRALLAQALHDAAQTAGSDTGTLLRVHDVLADPDGAAHAVAGADSARSPLEAAGDAVLASVPARLAMTEGGSLAEAAGMDTVRGTPTLHIAPPVQRTSLVPRPWSLNPLTRLWHRLTRRADPDPLLRDSPDPRGVWSHAGRRRRWLLLALMIAQTSLATHFMADVLPYHGADPLEFSVLTLFVLLFGWVSAGFWTAVMGFFTLLFGGDRYMISRMAAGDAPIEAQARTAIVMPICNEDVARVFAGLRATYESLAKTGDLDRFDVFILSDSNDTNICTAEVDAWQSLCRAVDGFGRIFYRRRQRRVKRKSGNLDDFCRRWGGAYRYMVVLDADSVMSGECLTKLVRLMEGHPSAGLIQTAPLAAGRETFYARVQQFAGRVYGPLFTAGLHYWQLGESHYWGHNAIIRMKPFIEHCALAPMPGKGALSGPILSHDFVEAALMRRAGWGVWIAYDLQGSYEEMPPNLLDELKRDRRWCQGNLMNFKLFMAEGMHPVHRAVFVTGVMAYISAPLWFLFLILSTCLLAKHTLVVPEYFSAPRQLFPLWPEWHPERAVALFTATATMLFLPKILAVVLIWVKGAKRFGGALPVTLSMIIELVFSALLAPVRMLFHTQFVLAALTGIAIQWKSPPREDAETHWGEAFRRHGLHTLLGAAWGGIVYWLNPNFIWWLMPIVGAMMLSIPLSVFSSRVSLGRGLKRLSLFLIPEESWPPKELRWTEKYALETRPGPDFIATVVDPIANALACATVPPTHDDPRHRATRAKQVESALLMGPKRLSGAQKWALINDPRALSQLHAAVWTDPRAHREWRDARANGLRQGYLESA